MVALFISPRNLGPKPQPTGNCAQSNPSTASLTLAEGAIDTDLAFFSKAIGKP